MAAFEVAFLVDEHIGVGSVSQLHIEYIHSVFAMNPQIFSRHIHDNPVPLAVIIMAKDGIVRKFAPQILRLSQIFIFGVPQHLCS